MMSFKVVQDSNGNKIVVEGDNLYLRLANDKRNRHIGRLNVSTKTLSVFRNRERHLHRKTNSYGFNHMVISQGTKFDKVLIRDEVACFLVTKQFLLDNGQFLYFKQQGFEKQIFVSLEKLYLHKILNIL